MRNLMTLLTLSGALFLIGCDDRFRYPCQDPKNWESAECKPPICSATATCPNDLVPPAKANQ